MGEETKKSSVAAQDQHEEILDEKLAKLLEEKLPEILAKTEEIKKKKEEQEKKRVEYVKIIQKYYPGAHTKDLSFEEVKEIAEKLEEIAKKTNYTPIAPAKPKRTFWGKNKKQSKAFILFLLGLLAFVIAAKIFIGWW